MLKRSILLILLLLTGGVRAANPALPTIEVYMPTVCLACIDWA